MDAEKSDAPGCHQEHRDRLPGLIRRTGEAKSRALKNADFIRSAVAGQDGRERLSMRLPFSRAMLRERAENISACSTWLRVKDFFELDDYQVDAMRCRQHLLCPACAILRGLNHVGSVIRRFESVRSESSTPMLPYLLTMGVKTGGDLAERHEHMAGSWRLLLADRRQRGRRGGNELSGLLGGVYSMEAKRSAKSLWNCHVHALVFSAHRLPVRQGIGADGKSRWYWPELSDRWREMTGDSFIVECHPIHKRCTEGAVTQSEAFEGITGAGGPDDLMAAVCEVSKYALKIADGSPGDAFQGWMALRGRRLCGSFGNFLGVDLEEDSESIKVRDLAAYVEYLYRFEPGAGGYSVLNYRVRPRETQRRSIAENDSIALHQARSDEGTRTHPVWTPHEDVA